MNATRGVAEEVGSGVKWELVVCCWARGQVRPLLCYCARFRRVARQSELANQPGRLGAELFKREWMPFVVSYDGC